MATKRTNTVTIRFGKGDQDDMDDFYDRLEASGYKSKSDFAKMLLSQALHPSDPVQGATIQALLRDVKDASSGIQYDLQELKRKNQQDRRAIANAVAVLLVGVGGYSESEAKRWVEKHILD